MTHESTPTRTDTKDLQLKIESRLIQVTDELAGQLRNKRESRGWSQAVLAEKAPISRKKINEIEGGKANPELRTILALAVTLGYGIRIEFTRL